MPAPKHQSCCGCMPIFSGIFAIAFHSFVHGIYGTCLILTTYYAHQSDVVNYTALMGYLCLVFIGFPTLWVVVFQYLRGVMLMVVLFVVLTIFNLACAIAYFIEYFSFRANSLLDKAFLWRYGSTWVDSEQLPFTIWHILTGLLIALTPLWFYYSYVIFLFPQDLEVRQAEAQSQEIIILENRFGPFGYRPPMGYPYSTNQPPEVVPEGHSILVYPPRPNRPGQQDNNPKSVLD